MSLQPTNSHRNASGNWASWFLPAAVCLVGLTTLFFELGDSKTFSSHEGYMVVPVREMLDSGDWLVPSHGGIPRLEKPPLYYWILATTVQVFGEISEWTCRLPAAISALCLIGLIGYWGAHWFGREVGLAAAFAASYVGSRCFFRPKSRSRHAVVLAHQCRTILDCATAGR